MGKGKKTYDTGGITTISACPLCEKVYDNHRIMQLHFKASHKNHSTKIDAEISYKKYLEVLNSSRKKIGLPPIVGL